MKLVFFGSMSCSNEVMLYKNSLFRYLWHISLAKCGIAATFVNHIVAKVVLSIEKEWSKHRRCVLPSCFNRYNTCDVKECRQASLFNRGSS
jgi:hypothetical protein